MRNQPKITKEITSDLNWLSKCLTLREKEFNLLSKSSREANQTVNHVLNESLIKCYAEHQHPESLYLAGLAKFQSGDTLGAWYAMKEALISAYKQETFDRLESAFFHDKGILESDIALYDDALVSLTQAIAKDSKNMPALLERASVYFEKGEFELALEDFASSGKSTDPMIQELLIILNTPLASLKGHLKA